MPRLTDAQALKLIRAALGGRGRLTVLRHAVDRMTERGFPDSDLRHAIQHGQITRCEPDNYGEDRFTVEGPTVETTGGRRRMGIVFKVISIDPPEAIVITTVDESKRYGRRRRG